MPQVCPRESYWWGLGHEVGYGGDFKPIGFLPHSDPQGAPGASGLKGDKVGDMLLVLSCASLSSCNPLSSTESPYLFLLNTRETQEQGRQGPEASVVNQVSGYVYVLTTGRAHHPSIVVLASDSQPLTPWT